MELVISGNSEPFQINGLIKPIELKLIGTYNSRMTLYYNNMPMQFDNGSIFFQFGERIKGGSVTDILFAFNDFQVLNNPQFLVEFSRKPVTEISLFKSVFLIYGWTEIAYTDAYAVSLGSKIYNEFILDYNSKPGTQEDIYFIKYELITNENMPLLKRLIEINLLASANFKGGNLGEYQTYFIPLIKPGVPREYFRHSLDESGSRTYLLWKNILSDRDTKISSWIKNRFKP